MLRDFDDQQLEDGQNQLRLLQMQIKQSQDERTVLDDQLPRGGGPMVARLAGPRRSLPPSRNSCRWTGGTRPPTGRCDRGRPPRPEQAEDELRPARAWREETGKGRLAPAFTPRQVRIVARLAVRISGMQAKLTLLDDELTPAPPRTRLCMAASPKLVAESRRRRQGGASAGQGAELSEMLTRQEARVARRDVMPPPPAQAATPAEQGRRGNNRAAQPPPAVAGARGQERRASPETGGRNVAGREFAARARATGTRSGRGHRQPDAPPRTVLQEHLEGPAAGNLDATRDDLHNAPGGPEKTSTSGSKNGEVSRPN